MLASLAATDTQAVAPWMLLFAFWASLALTLLKIGELIIAGFRRPRLDLRLTQDVLFRLIDPGECLFCNSVLLAWNGPVVIVDATLKLEKTDSPTKSFPLKVIQVGEKVKSTGPLAEHFFHGSSPIAHVAESDPQRVLYLCVQEKYQDQSRRLVQDFQKKVLDYKQELIGVASTGAKSPSEISQEFPRRVSQIVDETLPLMIDVVQLEPGEYRLSLEVWFKNPKSRLKRISKSLSAITFAVASDVREALKTALRQTLLVTASNLILDKQDLVIYPQYIPNQIQPAEAKQTRW
jgi:hypothetical protein